MNVGGKTMKKIFIFILTLCLIIPLIGCQNKKAELQKKYEDISYETQQMQKQVDDLQNKIDLDKAARDDADKSGATSDTEYGKTIAKQDDEIYNKALQQMYELQLRLETDKALQQSLRNQLDKMQ